MLSIIFRTHIAKVWLGPGVVLVPWSCTPLVQWWSSVVTALVALLLDPVNVGYEKYK